ncbi:hypothetical protein CP09DC79_0744B, partial [Chlamydia psittaci 09DC79]
FTTSSAVLFLLIREL